MNTNICPKHPDSPLIKKGKTKKGTQQYRCKGCMQKLHHDNYEKNKEKIKVRTRMYREANKEKINALKKEYRQKNIDPTKKIRDKRYREKNKIKINALHQMRKKEYSKVLAKSYLLKLLKENYGFKGTQVTSLLLEATKILYQLKRAIRMEKKK